MSNCRNSPRKRGAVIAVALIFIILITAIAASLLSVTSTQRIINERHVARLKAKTAAEMAIEYGVADLSARFDRQFAFDSDELAPNKRPLKTAPNMEEFLSDSDVDVTSVAVAGGRIPDPTWSFVNPNDPNNEGDDLIGRRVLARTVTIVGSASVETRTGGSITAYAAEDFSIRDAPLFSNAIFYNGDLELHPGFDLDVDGSVHTNRDAYVAVNPGYELNFFGSFSAVGRLIHGDLVANGAPVGGDVNFLAGQSPQILRLMNDGSGILDANSDNWLANSIDRWNRFVRDQSHDVARQNVVAFDDYTPDDPFTPENELNNAGYALIEPLLPAGHPDRKSTAVRNQKMASKAGLYLRVSRAGIIQGFAPRRANPADPSSPLELDADGNIVLDAITLPDGLVGTPNTSLEDIEVSNVIQNYGEFIWRGDRYVTQGLYDKREERPVDIVALDVGRLKTAIEENDQSATGFNGTFDAASEWNGVLYVEFPTTTLADLNEYGTSAGKNDYNIVPAASETGYNNYLGEVSPRDKALMLIDGKEIPNSNSLAFEGLSIATNGPLYVVGSFNADGVPHPRDLVEPDDAAEQPASLIADSITLLSDEWSYNRYFSGFDNVADHRYSSSFMEVSAALVAGTPPTIPDGAPYPLGDINRPHSLGAINLPRFLERWGGNNEVTIRGSMVSLYQSEVRPEGAPWNYNNYYWPPKRDWGYHAIFASGNFPPGTPLIRIARRLDYRELNKDEYSAELAGLHTTP